VLDPCISDGQLRQTIYQQVPADKLRAAIAPPGHPQAPADPLNLVTNAVVLWNTVYMSAVLDQLRSEGYNVDVVHLSPARYAHINPYRKYRFNVEGEFHRKGLRSLRRPDSALA
jgi:hypothetical protein